MKKQNANNERNPKKINIKILTSLHLHAPTLYVDGNISLDKISLLLFFLALYSNIFLSHFSSCLLNWQRKNEFFLVYLINYKKRNSDENLNGLTQQLVTRY